MIKKALLLGLSATLVTSVAWRADAQDSYPNRPIALVVPYPPGGNVDVSGRLIAATLSDALEQPVVVENKGGGGGTTGVAYVANATPDGYTIGVIVNSAYAVHPHLATPPYDVFNDLKPVALAMSSMNALIARNDFPASTLPELIDYAKNNPGVVTYASTGPGSTAHLFGEALALAADIEMVHVPYTGTAAAMTDLLAGRLDLIFDAAPAMRLESGQAKGIAVLRPERMEQFPELATIYEALPNYPSLRSTIGIVAPGETPDEIVKVLSDAVMKVSNDPDHIVRVAAIGLEVTALDADNFAQRIRSEYESYGNLIERAGIDLQN